MSKDPFDDYRETNIMLDLDHIARNTSAQGNSRKKDTGLAGTIAVLIYILVAIIVGVIYHNLFSGLLWPFVLLFKL